MNDYLFSNSKMSYFFHYVQCSYCCNNLLICLRCSCSIFNFNELKNYNCFTKNLKKKLAASNSETFIYNRLSELSQRSPNDSPRMKLPNLLDIHLNILYVL